MTSIEKAKSVLPLPELMARCGLGDRAKKSAKCPFHWIIALDDARNNADDKRGARFVSRFTKPSRNTQEEIPALEWHFVTDNGTGEVSISYKETQTLELFIQLIREGVSDCAELAEELKVSKSTISKWAKKMMDAGRLKKTNRKRYAPDDGPEAS